MNGNITHTNVHIRDDVSLIINGTDGVFNTISNEKSITPFLHLNNGTLVSESMDLTPSGRPKRRRIKKLTKTEEMEQYEKNNNNNSKQNSKRNKLIPEESDDRNDSLTMNTVETKIEEPCSNEIVIETKKRKPRRQRSYIKLENKKTNAKSVQRNNMVKKSINKRDLLNPDKEVNEDLCFVCQTGGFLICCDGCSNACHLECADPALDSIPEGIWFCAECNERLETGETVLPLTRNDDVNNNDATAATEAEKPVYVPHRRRRLRNQVQWNTEEEETPEMKLARLRREKWRKGGGKTKKEINACFESGSVPRGFTFIQSNEIHYSARKLMNQPEDIVTECHCVESCDINCINRLSRVECHKSCRLGKKCFNQNFCKMIYPAMFIFKTEKRGLGIKADEPIKRGSFITEYVGEVISVREFEKRHRTKFGKGKTSFYSMLLTPSVIIDASQKGNFGRFFNHSCSPNCFCELWDVNGERRVGIFAKRDIEVGEELTYDYNFECFDEGVVQECYCGSAECRGYIGVVNGSNDVSCSDSDAQDNDEEEDSDEINSDVEGDGNEDTCFVCQLGGVLICCDGCKNACHLECEDPPLESVPETDWFCKECRCNRRK
jgi:hypothetical protein